MVTGAKLGNSFGDGIYHNGAEVLIALLMLN